MYGGITRIAAIDYYQIIFMRRDPEEIKQSYAAFFGHDLRVKNSDLVGRLETVIGIMRARRDVDLIEVWYRDVVDNPKKAFSEIRLKGWPIDIDKVAAIVDKKQRRYVSEKLSHGA